MENNLKSYYNMYEQGRFDTVADITYGTNNNGNGILHYASSIRLLLETHQAPADLVSKVDEELRKMQQHISSIGMKKHRKTTEEAVNEKLREANVSPIL